MKWKKTRPTTTPDGSLFRRGSLLALMLVVLGAQAQQETESTAAPKASATSRFYFGGNVGVVFASDQKQMQAAPFVGFRFTDSWSAGLQLAVEYYAYDYPSGLTATTGDKITATAESYGWGGGLFSRYEIPLAFLQDIGSGIYLHAEYDYTRSGWHYKNDQKTDDARNQHEILAGAGLYFPVGRGKMALTALWNVWHWDQSPYTGVPVLRIGFLF
jgi:hypothetical protein